MFDFDDTLLKELEGDAKSVAREPAGFDVLTPSVTNSQVPLPSNKIIEMVLMQKTVFHKYPNGIMYHQKAESKAWWVEQVMPEKKQEEKADVYKKSKEVDEI